MRTSVIHTTYVPFIIRKLIPHQTIVFNQSRLPMTFRKATFKEEGSHAYYNMASKICILFKTSGDKVTTSGDFTSTKCTLL